MKLTAARLGAIMQFASSGSLAGATVAVTTARGGGDLARALGAADADVLWAPTVAYADVPPERIREETVALLGRSPAAVVVATGDGFHRWLDRLGALRTPLLEALARSQVAARGRKAHRAMLAHGIVPAFRHDHGESLAELALARVPHGPIGVQTDGGGSASIVDRLARAGRLAGTVAPYRWTLPGDRSAVEQLVRRTLNGDVDVVVFTSAPAVRGLADIAADMGAGGPLADAMQRRARVAAIGARTAEAAERLAWPVTISPSVSTTDALVAAVRSAATGDPARIPPLMVLDHDRRTVTVDSAVLVLTDTEFALLAALLRRWDCSRPASGLLAEVWGNGARARRRLEVHVSRLRAKLEGHGVAIVAVPKRGYRLQNDMGGAP